MPIDVLNLGLIKSCLLALHLFGLVLGLGAATMLDLIILRFVGEKKITREYWSVIALLSKAVTGGLVLLWLSGSGFLAYYAFSNPTLLTNPKIWAKLTIVGALSVNGVFIHRVVLPLIRQRIGRPLFEGLTNFQRSCLLTSGAISGMSWWIPLMLAAFPQLNFTVAAETILLAYVLLLTLAIISASLLVRYVLPQLATITLPRTEYDALVSRLSALARNAEVVAPAAFGSRRDLGYGSTTGVCDAWEPIAGSARSYKSARLESARVAIPAVLAVLGIFACSAHAFRSPVSSFRFDRYAQASNYAERQHVSPSVRLASSAEHKAPDQGAAGVLPLVAPTYEINAEPQFESPSQNAIEKGSQPVVQRQALPKATFVGIWGVDADACSARASSNPPAVISENGAAAGGTFCAFEDTKHAGSSWQVLARCFNDQERWTSIVRLTVKGDRLKWASQRGVQNYQRCERGLMLATTRHASF